MNLSPASISQTPDANARTAQEASRPSSSAILYSLTGRMLPAPFADQALRSLGYGLYGARRSGRVRSGIADFLGHL
jgi:hypothetical protein